MTKRYFFGLLFTFFAAAVWAQDRPRPLYIDGEQALMEFMRANLKMPDLARENNIDGRVIAQFNINAKGRITNLELDDRSGGLFIFEARRFMEFMDIQQPSKWLPAVVNGVVVTDVPVRLALRFIPKNK